MFRAIGSLLVCFVWASLVSRGTGKAVPKSESPSQQPYTISVNVGLVVLPITVTDSKGAMIDNLTPDNFIVTDDGRPETLTYFEHDDVPATVGLVVDDSASMLPKRTDVEYAALAFAHSSNSEDQMFVVHFSEKASLGLASDLPFTADLRKLLAGIAQGSASGETALYDGVLFAIDHLKTGTRERKALIVVSDGVDDASRHSLRDVVRSAQNANVVVYALGLTDEHYASNPGVLERMAKLTGGEAFFPATLQHTVSNSRTIARDIRRQYVLAYSPENSAPGYHHVRVAIKGARTGRCRVRTKSGYDAGPASNPRQVAAVKGGGQP
jgi:VWFA-related protein